MHAHDDRDQFAPPRPPARLAAITLALLVHALLIAALTWGVNWKHSAAEQPAVEVELWAAIPQTAAPRAEPPPQASPAPAPKSEPEPPSPPARAAPAPDTQAADLAIAREKKRMEQAQKEIERKQAERRERLEQEKKQELQKAQREKLLAEQKKAEQQEKQKREEQRKTEAQRLAEQRQAHLRRIQDLAETAQRNAGPSAAYQDLVTARVRPHIVYPDALPGNPRAVVEVRIAPDGRIIDQRLLKASGNKSWDEAVLRALEKTETLPPDTDGRIPPSLEIGFQPH